MSRASGVLPLLLTCAWLAIDGRALAASQTVTPSDDTFINQGNPDNNNGATLSLFTGTDGHGGVMRGLVRFGLPAGLRGRVTVTGVQLAMVVEALGNGTLGTPATVSLQAVSEAWSQGNGFGGAPSAFTVGQQCGGSVVGATWNQPNCTSAAAWGTAGGTVAAAVSGQASTSGVPLGGQVVWSSTANGQMIADVQGWIDDPTSNHGWRLASSTEGAPAQAQRFSSRETTSAAPALVVTYDCKPGFVASGTDCVVAVAAVPAGGPRSTAWLAVVLCAAAVGRLVTFRRPYRRRRPGAGGCGDGDRMTA